ncbi:YegP family protein [Robertkochia flava]|uniref:YegP family protein n=1 Tax=Robertkochia flava TaxID=3447986 RepID=UPI001CCACFB1|nr:YegP family protein [Robertkochia marina]
MAMFVISKRKNGHFKFDFTSKRGTPIFSSLACKHKTDCEQIIEAIRVQFDQFTLTKKSTPAGKHFFRLSRNGLVLASSRYFSTPLRLEKGLDEIERSLQDAEVLDFSENEDIFGSEEAFKEAI